MTDPKPHQRMEACPDRDRLMDLIDDSLQEDEQGMLVRHLDECEDCREFLDQHPAFLDCLKRVRQLNAQEEDSKVLQETLQQLKRNVGTIGASNRTESDIESWARSIDGYEVIRQLGQGGMGVVLLAREISLDRLVAIKLLAPALAGDENAKERFLREARAAASVNHPNVVTIHAVIESNSPPCIVMEYVDGESLQARLERTPKLPWDEIVRVGQQLADALAAAHDQGLIHRDIKPANVLIDSKSGQIKLGDFGLARTVNQTQLTRTGVVVGTPEYLAPEWLVEGSSGDHRADLFSLGSLLYAMCCGRSPFAADSVLATLYRIASAEPTPLVEKAPETPGWLIAIIEQLLRKNPDERIESAKRLAQQLRSPVASRVVDSGIQEVKNLRGSRSQSTIPRKVDNGRTPKSKTNRGLAWSVLTATLLLTVWMVFSWWPENPTSHVLVEDADGKVLGDFETLEEAIQEAPREATLVIEGNGPFALESTRLDQDVLTIQAADGFRPLVILESKQTSHEDDSDEEDSDEDQESLLTSENILVLEGLDLSYTSEDDDSARSLVGLIGGELIARNCRFRNQSDASCLILDAAAAVRLESCLIHGIGGYAIEVLGEEEDEAEVWLDNCVLTAEGGFLIECEEQATLNMDHCTLIASTILQLEMDPELDDEPTDPPSIVSCTARSSVMACELAVVGIATLGEPFQRSQLSRFVSWRGVSNRYWGPWMRIHADGDAFAPEWLNEWSEWKSHFEESDSEVLASMDSTLDDDWLDDLIGGWEHLEPSDLEQLRQRGLVSEGIGVDFDSLGW